MMIETDYKVDVGDEEDVDEVEGGGGGRGKGGGGSRSRERPSWVTCLDCHGHNKRRELEKEAP